MGVSIEGPTVARPDRADARAKDRVTPDVEKADGFRRSSFHVFVADLSPRRAVLEALVGAQIFDKDWHVHYVRCNKAFEDLLDPVVSSYPCHHQNDLAAE